MTADAKLARRRTRLFWDEVAAILLRDPDFADFARERLNQLGRDWLASQRDDHDTDTLPTVT